ncbi:MAG: hypothetical protein RIR72_462 [Actinomycetota bacterium]
MRRAATLLLSTPLKSRPSISICEAKCGVNSSLKPVRIFTTPAGTSEVARHSARVIADSGRFWLASNTAQLPAANTGASPKTTPSSEDFSSATTPTTPSGSATVKLKKGPATGLVLPAIVEILSLHPAYQTQVSIACLTCT